MSKNKTSGVFSQSTIISLITILMLIYVKKYIPIEKFPSEIQKWVGEFLIGIFTGIIVKIFSIVKSLFSSNLED